MKIKLNQSKQISFWTQSYERIECNTFVQSIFSHSRNELINLKKY